MREISRLPLTEEDFERAASRLRCDIAAIKAVSEVEAPKGAFLPTGEPTILFERHYFHRLTGGKFDQKRVPDLPGPLDKYSLISSVKSGGYGPESIQHKKLDYATQLDRDAALMSCSWGKFQIMGANFRKAGHKTLQSFVDAMYTSAADHLDAFVEFVISEHLDDELREHNWRGFASGYNGQGYERNQYHLKLPRAWEKFSSLKVT